MPYDPERMSVHRTACLRLERMATGIVQEIGARVVETNYVKAKEVVDRLVADREACCAAAGKRVPFGRAKELTSARNKLKTQEKHVEAGFNPNNSHQRKALLYVEMGLPEVRNRKTKKATTDDEAIESLISRLDRGTLKVKKRDVPQARRVLYALRAANKWSHWRRNYLEQG